MRRKSNDSVSPAGAPASRRAPEVAVEPLPTAVPVLGQDQQRLITSGMNIPAAISGAGHRQKPCRIMAGIRIGLDVASSTGGMDQLRQRW